MNIDIGFVLLQYFCLLFSLCIHEAAHAAMANYCGDPTARLMGRLTLNPVKHADPLGTVILPLFMMLTSVPYLFGWAKPVPFNPRNLNNMRRDPMLIALAGPGSNLLAAFACALILRILISIFGLQPDVQIAEILMMIAIYLIMINLLLLLFNLIPVPPLDGHHVLEYFLPPGGQRVLAQIGPFGILIAILVARPWLSFAMPKLQYALLWFVTWGQEV
ncbi:MAG TPA: site-2 protease family protein [Candidatus Hydrogenedentes bacterium]|nr:site-2 protease family protein [Candidatus Hydrogenedentota bacterium]HNT88665.1 site-2 protease family protein [Candidatus Hydrogenedentota bacterium]